MPLWSEACMHIYNVSPKGDYELLPPGSKRNLRPNIRRVRSDPVIRAPEEFCCGVYRFT